MYIVLSSVFIKMFDKKIFHFMIVFSLPLTVVSTDYPNLPLMAVSANYPSLPLMAVNANRMYNHTKHSKQYSFLDYYTINQ